MGSTHTEKNIPKDLYIVQIIMTSYDNEAGVKKSLNRKIPTADCMIIWTAKDHKSYGFHSNICNTEQTK